MGAPANVSEIVNRMTGGNNGNPEQVFYLKDSTGLTLTAGVVNSLWKTKGQPGIGVTPTSGAVPTSATAGAMRLTDPGGGRKRWLRNLTAHNWTAGRLVLYDRLAHCGGFSGTVTTAQNFGTSVTRYTGTESFGNIAAIEVYTTIGATPTTFTCSYLDSTGTTRTSAAVAIGGANGRNVGDLVPMQFDPTIVGANSVTQVVSVTLAGTTGTAGNFGITILRPIAEVVVGNVDISGFGHGSRMVALEDMELKTGACLAMFVQGLLTGTNFARASFLSVEN